MRTTRGLYVSLAALVVAASLAGMPTRLSAQQSPPAAVSIGDSDIGGVVTSAKGPEAGVWVIAETTDLPTKFVKIVVTDDQGRYVLPELPKANYDVWVRGYGLVDSPKVKAAPGKALDLKAVVAPSDAAAAEYYPAQYWYSMLQIPDKSLFPGTGTGPGGNGMSEHVKNQGQWLATSRPTPATPATSSATSPPAPFPRNSENSNPRTRPGCIASRSGPLPRSWCATSAKSTPSLR